MDAKDLLREWGFEQYIDIFAGIFITFLLFYRG